MWATHIWWRAASWRDRSMEGGAVGGGISGTFCEITKRDLFTHNTFYRNKCHGCILKTSQWQIPLHCERIIPGYCVWGKQCHATIYHQRWYNLLLFTEKHPTTQQTIICFWGHLSIFILYWLSENVYSLKILQEIIQNNRQTSFCRNCICWQQATVIEYLHTSFFLMRQTWKMETEWKQDTSFVSFIYNYIKYIFRSIISHGIDHENRKGKGLGKVVWVV